MGEKFFISFTSSDQKWAEWIGSELRALGHEAFVHVWEIRPGEDIYAWMEQRHDEADHVICVVSDAYMKAPFSTLERNAALWKSAKLGANFALLALVEPITLPNLVDFMRRCELYGVSDGEARQRFRDFLAERKAPDIVMFPGKERSLSNVPISVPQYFLGREDALQAVDAALKRYEGRVAITAVHGLRGVGKSTLAAAYAERHLAEYRAIWWIRAQTPDSMRADLVSLGVRLKWVAADEKEEPAYQHVMERLRHEGDGLLLIYDNAIDCDALIPFLPKGGAARVLVTSNTPAWRGLAEPIELKLWPKAIGADYMIARTGRTSERVDAEALSEALGGLPLAHEQAAAYCERLHVSFADYARRLATTPIKLLDAEKDAPLEYHDKLTVAKTFALAIAEAGKLHPAAEPLIVHAALLAPEPIPLFLFEDGREALDEPLASALADDGLEEALAALEAFALVDREEVRDEREPEFVTKCFRLHRLVRTVAAARCNDRGPALAALLGAMQRAFEVAGYMQDVRSWPRARRLAGLAAPLLSTESLSDPIRLTQAEVASALAVYRQSALADYGAARQLYIRALVIRETALGPEHPDTATSLNNLGFLLREQGDLAGARPLLERALAIWEKAHGPDHPYTLAGLNNLGLLLKDQGNLVDARSLFERGLAISEKALGPEHPNTARNLNHLGHLLWTQGDLASARPFYERALAIREAVLGPEHPDTGNSLNNLGFLLRDLGDLAGARPLLERALAICVKALGPDHPNTATSLNNLGLLLGGQGDFAGARALHKRALAIYEKALGSDHPNTANSLNNLAALLRDQGDPVAARPIFERAHAILTKSLGPDHSLTKRVAAHLARLPPPDPPPT